MSLFFIFGLAVTSVAPTGSLFAMVSDEFVSSSPWAPSSTCGGAPFGPCPANTVCCIDPVTHATQGACYKTQDCTQLKDENVTLGLRLVRVDLESGNFHTSASMPLPPHSGALTRPVADGKGQLFVQVQATGAGATLHLHPLLHLPQKVSSGTAPGLLGDMDFGENASPQEVHPKTYF